MTSLDIDLKVVKYGLEDYDDENGYLIPSNDETAAYKRNLITLFDDYKEKFRRALAESKDFNIIIKYDVLLYYLYKSYVMAIPEDVSENIINDEDDIVGVNFSMYTQDIEYPKILKITATF
jgi:hypothetical protein